MFWLLVLKNINKCPTSTKFKIKFHLNNDALNILKVEFI
jgi:hypothetical protein